jgi:hypothetical protein
MDKTLKISKPWVNVIRYFGRGLLIVWAGFWVYFAFASALSETYPNPDTNALGWVIVITGTLLLAGGAIIPWIWERLGGFILFGIGLFLLVFFLISARFQLNIWMLSVILPAFLSGTLSLICGYMERKLKSA